MNTVFKRPIFILPVIILGTLSLLYFGALLPEVIPSVISASLSGNDFVDARLKYQLVIFGIPHYFGVPGGILGLLMAGFLGWLLAKSIAETEGMFWAWFIHFLPDVIIFTGLFLVAL